eukprot:TRINITY_DN30148_c0_g1_i1.p1 TRINITY_DN30148_c0_g1~~TRINITY_DN30148_c0_g1_i1.p1  ORF type:complete len:312 (+),score=99.59 TRINITY_DN30148_c0_g1_i1:69-1004(+)
MDALRELWQSSAVRFTAGIGAAVVIVSLLPRASCFSAALSCLTPLRRWLQKLARRRMVRRLKRYGVEPPAPAAPLAELPTEVEYPQYYLREYHTYPAGNLCWEAACEADAMALSAALIAYPEKGREADWYMHSQALAAIPDECGEAREVLDAGCGVGQSAFPLRAACPAARVTAVDLSPYFLSQAQRKDGAARICWQQHNLEALPGEWAGRFDVATLVGVTHELPPPAVRRALRELHRVLRPGGTLLAMDVDPQNILKMPRFVYAMFRSTEPDMDEYVKLDVPGEIRQAGFDARVVADAVRRRVVVVAKKQ